MTLFDAGGRRIKQSVGFVRFSWRRADEIGGEVHAVASQTIAIDEEASEDSSLQEESNGK